MKQYLREREQQERKGNIIGGVLAVGIPVLCAVFCSFTGMKYLYPPPPESTFLMDFTEEIEPVVQNFRGSAPRAEEVDLSKPVELIQKSESPHVAETKQNLTPATRPDTHGDIETPEPPRKEEPKLDPRAAFPGMAKKDTSLTAPHTATTASTGFKAGQPQGNTDSGKAEGAPNAHLQGRNVVGSLTRPSYGTQASGTVVVKIIVDRYGTVKSAVAGVEGTTVTDKDLWNAARKAAMESHFNQKADAPALQEGTITYIFKLK